MKRGTPHDCARTMFVGSESHVPVAALNLPQWFLETVADCEAIELSRSRGTLVLPSLNFCTLQSILLHVSCMRRGFSLPRVGFQPPPLLRRMEAMTAAKLLSMAVLKVPAVVDRVLHSFERLEKAVKRLHDPLTWLKRSVLLSLFFLWPLTSSRFQGCFEMKHKMYDEETCRSRSFSVTRSPCYKWTSAAGSMRSIYPGTLVVLRVPRHSPRTTEGTYHIKVSRSCLVELSI